MNIPQLYKLRDRVVRGDAPVTHLVAVFDLLLEELQVRRPELRPRTNAHQLELWEVER